MRPENHLEDVIQMHADELLNINSFFLFLNQRVKNHFQCSNQNFSKLEIQAIKHYVVQCVNEIVKQHSSILKIFDIREKLNCTLENKSESF